MSECFLKSKCLRADMKIELDLPNYATKTDLKNETGIDASGFAKKIDLAN